MAFSCHNLGQYIYFLGKYIYFLKAYMKRNYIKRIYLSYVYTARNVYILFQTNTHVNKILNGYHNDIGFSINNFILLMKSSTGMVPSSPPNLDLMVTVCVSISFEPTTAINGIFCFSAFLMSFGRRSP